MASSFTENIRVKRCFKLLNKRVLVSKKTKQKVAELPKEHFMVFILFKMLHLR